VYLSARSGAWFLRRVWDNGLPLDLAVFTRFISFLMRWLPDSFVCRVFRKRANARFDHALYGLLPSHEITAGPAIVNDDLPSRILSGSVQVRPGIARLTSSGVQFTDGTYVDDIDAVICGTGWSKCTLPLAIMSCRCWSISQGHGQLRTLENKIVTLLR